MIATKSEFHIPDFKVISYPEGDTDVNHIVTSYQSAISDLIKQLEGGKLSKEQQTYVIYLLGALRAVGAATILVEYIDFEAPVVDPKSAIGRWGLHPAAEALVKIGRPSVNEILAKAQRPQNDSRLKQMAIVIQEVEGTEVARLLVQAAVANAPDANSAGHARSLLGVFGSE